MSAAAERSRDCTLNDRELGELAFALDLLDGRTAYQRDADGTRPVSRRALDALALLLGLRAGEVLRIQAGDIQEDGESGFVLLRIAAGGGKTAAANCDLPLPPLALSLLRRSQQECGNGALFPSPSAKAADTLTVDGLSSAARRETWTSRCGGPPMDSVRPPPYLRLDPRRTRHAGRGPNAHPGPRERRRNGPRP